ncbi:MAG: methyltransferase [Roseiflexaceae bacterium]
MKQARGGRGAREQRATTVGPSPVYPFTRSPAPGVSLTPLPSGGSDTPLPSGVCNTPLPWRTVEIGGLAVAIPDDPLCAADATDPANSLLAGYATLEAGDRVLVLGAGCGLLAAWAAARAAPGRLILSDTHSATLDRAAATLRRNGHTDFGLLPAERLADLEMGAFDVALANSAFQSSSRALTEALRAAGRALRPGGRLYVAGAKAQGIGAIKARLAEIFGAAGTLGYRKGVHVVAATRPEHLAEAETAPPETIDVTVRGHAFCLALREGVFARGGLDDGTRMLLDAIEAQPDDRVLDLGCGGGIVGMLLARLAPQGHATLVDSDTAAVALARENLRANQIGNATVCAGDGLDALPGATFDLIATNPPFHLGRRQTIDIAYRFIAAAAGALRPGGRLYVVANRFLPYERAMLDVFGDLREIAGDRRYKVLLAIRS